jgi:methanogenic corrinoid protein MtbC1
LAGNQERDSMTTEEQPIADMSKRLTEVILKGDDSDAAKIATKLARERKETNEVVDAISETMNIVADLHEVERYSLQQVESCERAAERALDAIRPGIRVEQRRISGKVMVTSLRGDPHTFDKTLLLTMLEMGGFSAVDGGEEMSPDDITRKVSLQKPDVLAIPLLSKSAVDNLMDTKTRLAQLGTKTRLVVYGRGVSNIPQDSGLKVAEEDSLSAMSKITEILLAR